MIYKFEITIEVKDDVDRLGNVVDAPTKQEYKEAFEQWLDNRHPHDDRRYIIDSKVVAKRDARPYIIGEPS